MKHTLPFLLLAAACAAQPPAAIWTSHPVDPGDAVIVFGGPFPSNAVVQVAGKTIRPLAVTPETVTFVYPPNRPLEAFTATVSGAAVPVNAPAVWWIQGDLGRTASPGGWLRVFGRSIAFNDSAALEIGSVKCPAERFDRFDLRVQIPAKLKPGTYDAVLNNGLVRQPVGKVTIEAPVKPELAVFDITRYGAIANDLRDDTRAILAALDAIRKNNGGVLYVPRGRFGMRGTLELPPNSVLRGEDVTLSMLQWPDEDNPKGPLVCGTHDFALENIFLASGNIDQGIVTLEPGKTNDWTNVNVALRRVRTRFLHTDSGDEEGLRRIQQKPEALQLRLRAENLVITDCDFYASKGSSGIHATWALITGNRFGGPDCTYYGGRYFIMEGNDHSGQAMSFANGTRDALVKGNRFGSCFGNGDRETFTFDGGCPCYYGPAESVGETTIRFPKFGWNKGQAFWLGKPVYIVAGTGRGQYRDIAKMISPVEVEIASPWTIKPDETSRFAIAHNRYNILLLDNVINDGNPFQLYGSAVDVVIANNRTRRNSGIQSHAMGERNGPKPNWFIQFLGNQILEGNSFRGPQSYQNPARDSWLGFFDQGMPGPDSQPQNLVGVMRNNILRNNAFIGSHGRVRHLLIDGNTVCNADKGVEILAPDVKEALVRRMTFENVVAPMNLHSGVAVPPEDYLARMIHILETRLPEALPANWKQLKTLPPEQAGPQIIAAVAAKLAGKPVPPEVFTELTGINPSQRNPWPLGRIASGRVKQWDFHTDFVYSPICPPAVLSHTGIAPAGWSVLEKKPKSLTPGEEFSYPIGTGRTDSAPVTVSVPIHFSLVGDTWKLCTVYTYRCDYLSVNDFQIAGPFPMPESKRALDAADLVAKPHDAWRPLVCREEYRVPDLAKAAGTAENAVFLAKTVLRAKKPMTVQIDFEANPRTVAFFNGERMGSSTRRDQNRSVDLQPGDNTLMLVVVHEKGEHRLPVTVLTDGTEAPGDLIVVPAGE